MTFGNRIRKLRQDRGWTQNFLASKAGVPQPTIWRLEKGSITSPKYELLRKIADAFEIGLDELTGGTQRQLSLFEKAFPGDATAPTVFRGYEKLSPKGKERLVEFLKILEEAESSTQEEETREEL
jgi:transcriptional regulator with XRE-family HTH domain